LVMVENRIDLDEAAELLRRHRPEWQRAGMEVETMSWRDVGEPWPYPQKVDRAAVIDADSVGVRARKGGREGRVVLLRGGWADLEYWSSLDEPLFEAPGVDNPLGLDDFDRLLDRFADLFRKD
jgi:hypothetical protein